MMLFRVQTYFCLCLLFFCKAGSASAQIGMGARSSGLNHATTALNNNDWSIYGNPATVHETKQTVSFYYVRYYGLSELADAALSASYPLKWGVLSAGIHSYGFDLYRETDIQLGWMMKFQELKTALRLHYDHIAFGGPYGSDGAFGIDLGFFFPITEYLDAGGVATNLNRPEIGLSGQERARIMSIGLVYKPLDKGLIALDLIKDVRYPISTRVGLEYPLIDALVLRAGIGTQPVNTTFGAGFAIKQFSVNIAAERHQELGWSPGVDIGFTW